MPQETSPSAFSSEDHVRQVALRISKMSDAIHHTLRQLAESKSNSNSTALYALLTEEYALRARANILLIGASLFVRPDSLITHQEVLSSLDEIEAALATVWSQEEFTELIVGLMLFGNSIASRNSAITSLLLNNLKQLIRSHAP